MSAWRKPFALVALMKKCFWKEEGNMCGAKPTWRWSGENCVCCDYTDNVYSVLYVLLNSPLESKVQKLFSNYIVFYTCIVLYVCIVDTLVCKYDLINIFRIKIIIKKISFYLVCGSFIHFCQKSECLTWHLNLLRCSKNHSCEFQENQSNRCHVWQIKGILNQSNYEN